MRIAKLHGLGNDYLIYDGTKGLPDHLPELAVQLSDRHFGVGSDGLICILPSQTADFRMRMFNADGSEGEMCGNGIRCMAKFIHDHGLSRRETLNIETMAGTRTVQLLLRDGEAVGATVEMGAPELLPTRTVDAAGGEFQVYPVSMGNPHAVIFVEDLERTDVGRIGPALERHPAFPDRTNVEFVTVEAAERLNMRVWERGSGETLACGTGACAALAAAVSQGRCNEKAEALLPGGTLHITWDRLSGSLFLTGPAVTVFEGEVFPPPTYKRRDTP